ncbi:structural protein [Pseudomonas phage vB_PcuM_ KLEP17-4]|nr:structural protein [Pseudomonas phage vB_PcuM_ KLEP17-4]
MASEAMAKAIAQIKRAKLQVGWFDTAQYEDGTPVAYVAAIQEFGYPKGGIPPRPFLRPTIEQQRNAWRDSIAAGMRTVLEGKRSAREVLERVGMLAAGNVSESIAAVTSPALKQSTLDARQRRKKTPGVSNKPLVDTGLLIQSVDSKVTE